MTYTNMKRVAAGALALLSPGLLLADSISPSSYATTLAVGESVTISKTVTVTKGAPTSAVVDVFFMADTTGSMGGTINAVKAGASSILSSIAALGSANFAVGEYKDVGDVYIYRQNQSLTSSQAAAQAGINMWGASGGGDTPEAQLYALQTAATATAWRSSSTRIMVWFGDAPGHDPRNGATEVSATAALNANNVKVEAIDVGNLNGYGQASRIAAATGGSYFAGINPTTIVAAITSAITKSFEKYTTVELAASGLPAGVSVSATPGSYTGVFDRSIDRTFSFDVTFTGVSPGDYSFDINALVDDGIIATESDRIRVEKGSGVPDGGSTLLLLGGGLMALGAIRRKM